MRNTPNVKAERYRVRRGVMASDSHYGNNGAFLVPCGKETLMVVASDGAGWDHVSVSLQHRCPTWEEICFVKDLFFRDDEWAVQFHPARSAYVNDHPYCLHLWRCQSQETPKPPAWMVGPGPVTATPEHKEAQP